jgi:hypothetical protein
MIAIKVNDQRLRDLGAKAEKFGRGSEVAAVAGRAVAGMLREHLFDLDAERPNKMGGARTHFFGDCARSVQNPEVEGNAAVIAINQVGLAQRWLGGIIRPVTATLLAIPARAEAYGKAPGEFNDLEFVPTGKGRGMLVQAMQTQVSTGNFGHKIKTNERYKTTTVGALVMFWLVDEVNQAPDPTVMPTDEEMGEAAGDAVEVYLNRNLK